MAHQWFRLYSEFASDHKMQMMSEAYQRRYVMLLCLRCSNGDVTLHDNEVAFQLRVTPEEWAQTKIAFIDRNLIDNDNKVVAWDRRQFVSDSSAERVARHRERKKQECNVTVTPLDTDTDTEQKNKNNSRKNDSICDPYFEMFWETYDYKIDKAKAIKSWNKIKPDGELAMKICQAADRYVIATPDRAYRRHPTTWLNNRSWENEVIDKRYAATKPSKHATNPLYSNQPQTEEANHGRIIDATPLLG